MVPEKIRAQSAALLMYALQNLRPYLDSEEEFGQKGICMTAAGYILCSYGSISSI